MIINCPYCNTPNYVNKDSDVIICSKCGKIFILDNAFRATREI